MSRPTAVLGFLLLAAGSLVAEIPPEERIPVTDPDRLEALGFPRDTTDIYVWSKANFAGSHDEAGGLRPAGAKTWGPATGYTTVTPSEFVNSNDVGIAFNPSFEYGTLVCSAGSVGEALAQVEVPDGVALGFLGYWAYDNSDEDLHFDVIEKCQSLGSITQTSTVIGGAFTFGKPGAISTFGTLGGVRVNNKDCAYILRARFSAGDGNELRLRKLRVSWNRQVSPAPAAATFADVPTNHIYFRAIEALNDSGITQGCGGGNFCPGGNLTRGEMAAFLARALGLSWP